MKLGVLLIISFACLLFTLPNVFRGNTISSETRKFEPAIINELRENEEYPEQTVLNYIHLSRKGNFAEIDELITTFPETSNFPTRVTRINEEKKKRLISKNKEIGVAYNSAVERLVLLDIREILPESLKIDDQRIQEIKIINKSVKGVDAVIRVKIHSRISPESSELLRTEYIFSLRKESQKWKIFDISDPNSYAEY